MQLLFVMSRISCSCYLLCRESHAAGHNATATCNLHSELSLLDNLLWLASVLIVGVLKNEFQVKDMVSVVDGPHAVSRKQSRVMFALYIQNVSFVFYSVYWLVCIVKLAVVFCSKLSCCVSWRPY